MQDVLLTDATAAPGTDNEEIRGKHMVFSICGVNYAIEIESVTEIIGIQPITPVPNLPGYVKGIANVRGTIVPVVDMRAKFGLESVAYDERTCIILASRDEINIGLIVDAVEDVIQLAPEDILPPPRGNADGRNKYLKAIGKYGDKVEQILDIAKIMDAG
ncbi:MAG: chemotaxis protein CheW [Oscillospiraceae bacterium]|nr:chemotaxis protein CheW [Oscillospiraceae bacterium]